MNRPPRNARRALVVVVLALVVAGVGDAVAETPGQRAEALNRQGKQQIAQVDFDGAVKSFRAAIAIVPDPRYYYNLCYTLDRAGRNEEARAACQIAAADQKDARLAAKARDRIASIDREAGGPAATTGSSAPAAGDTLADDEAVGGTGAGGNGEASAAVATPGPAAPAGAASRPAVAVSAGPPAPTAPAPRPTRGFGLRLGLGGATLEEEGDTGAELGGSFAFGGAFTAWIGSAVGIQLEGMFASRGSAYSGLTSNGDLIEGSVDLTYLDLVAAARIEAGRGGVRPYGFGGFYLGLRLSAEASIEGVGSEDIADSVAGTDAGLVLGGGLAFGGFRRSFTAELRYQHGVADILDGAGSSFNRVYLLVGGYQF